MDFSMKTEWKCLYSHDALQSESTDSVRVII